ncbi:nucleotide exchange factor GrpE [Virgibacillus sp. MSP4-1]|uniref:nucleotide exchange factor GrpE n=1 Tax=Virgibacillus sp. MSP4-1 TaxID=2700081 RepID=UPI0003A260FB|nr:nucleotide exchange factor GrpE [Virgibacillus sp. MSP4-1]QHS22815.1 nucleotide exchange factor GrpE [Virgibacillus sp. MSP4-1]
MNEENKEEAVENMDEQEELRTEEDTQENTAEEVTVEDAEVEMQQDDTEDNHSQALEEELEAVKKEKDEMQNKLLRVQADFDNFKRRAKKDRENDLKYKSQDVVTELLPILDNFERALQVDVDGESTESFVDGMNMIYRQLVSAMEKAGVEEIEAEGKVFDPNIHQAVMQDSNNEKESNTVTEVLQKGYMLKDRVIRPAMVKVNQ